MMTVILRIADLEGHERTVYIEILIILRNPSQECSAYPPPWLVLVVSSRMPIKSVLEYFLMDPSRMCFETSSRKLSSGSLSDATRTQNRNRNEPELVEPRTRFTTVQLEAD